MVFVFLSACCLSESSELFFGLFKWDTFGSEMGTSGRFKLALSRCGVLSFICFLSEELV